MDLEFSPSAFNFYNEKPFVYLVSPEWFNHINEFRKKIIETFTIKERGFLILRNHGITSREIFYILPISKLWFVEENKDIFEIIDTITISD